MDRIPEELQNLTVTITEALRVCDVDLGVTPGRHAAGFSRHGGILRLSWFTVSVAEKVNAQGGQQRDKAKDALQFLLTLRGGGHKKYFQRHLA